MTTLPESSPSCSLHSTGTPRATGTSRSLRWGSGFVSCEGVGDLKSQFHLDTLQAGWCPLYTHGILGDWLGRKDTYVRALWGNKQQGSGLHHTASCSQILCLGDLML